MHEKLLTALWFAKRPDHWAHGWGLARRKFLPNRDSPELRAQARQWAARQAVPVAEALLAVGLQGAPQGLSPALLAEGENLAREVPRRMGGPGDINLLFDAVRLSGAQRIIETGVAYGWSSLAILSALDGRSGAALVSVDMAYPKQGNEAFVGVVVPDRFRSPWTLVREPDCRGLEKAITRLGGVIDLCHYDSDKSWWGRHYAFPQLWQALKPGGIFISDDIQDNLYFAEFTEAKKTIFAITEFEGKYVGIMRK